MSYSSLKRARATRIAARRSKFPPKKKQEKTQEERKLAPVTLSRITFSFFSFFVFVFFFLFFIFFYYFCFFLFFFTFYLFLYFHLPIHPLSPLSPDLELRESDQTLCSNINDYYLAWSTYACTSTPTVFFFFLSLYYTLRGGVLVYRNVDAKENTYKYSYMYIYIEYNIIIYNII